MGVNCNQRAFPQELAGRACSLAELLGSQVALPELLADILAALHATLRDEGWRARLERRLYGLGREALLSGPSGGIERGTVRGVAEDGALLLEAGGRVLPVYSGELSFQAEA
jgi:biotin-(acetyl-CoA carboxylase) ligase